MQGERMRELRHMNRSFILYSPDDHHLHESGEHSYYGRTQESSGDPFSNFSFSSSYTKESQFDFMGVDKRMQGFDIKSTKFKKALNATDPLRRVNSMYSPKSVYEEMQMARKVQLPKALVTQHHVLNEYDDSGEDMSMFEEVSRFLPHISGNKLVRIEPQMSFSEFESRTTSTASMAETHAQEIKKTSSDVSFTSGIKEPSPPAKTRIGIVLSGGPAPGGHNVVAGVFDYLKSRNPENQLLGFLGGLDGLKYKRYHIITEQVMDNYRNLGGFNMLLSGRGMVSTKMEYEMIVKNVAELDLDGLIIVGGDGSNSNAANISNYLENYYQVHLLEEQPLEETTESQLGLPNHKPEEVKHKVKLTSLPKVQHIKRCVVVGVPKTVDGDIRSTNIELTFGFDTAARTYSELIGNLCIDAASTQYNYHIVRVMGRSASHLALECAFQTHPNMVFISEEVSRKNISLQKIVDDIVDLMQKRLEMGKTYGVILIPEGLIEFIPDFKVLVEELNDILSPDSMEPRNMMSPTFDYVEPKFDPSLLLRSRETWDFLPPNIQEQLLSDIESTGCILVAKIATESLLCMLVQARIVSRNLHHLLDLTIMTHYFGYEGRCAIPTEFDSSYCYSLGYTASVLVAQKKNGYMAALRGLKDSMEDWVPVGIPFAHLTTLVETTIPQILPVVTASDPHRFGKFIKNQKLAIKKTLLDIDGDLFKAFEEVRDIWAYADLYRSPGPVQIANPSMVQSKTKLESYLEMYSSYDEFDRDDASSSSSSSSKEETIDIVELNQRRCYTLQIPTKQELIGNYPFEENKRLLRTKDKSFMSELERSRLELSPEIPSVCTDVRASMVPFKQYFDLDHYVKNQILIHYPYQHKHNHFNQYELVLRTDSTPLIMTGRNMESGWNKDGVANGESDCKSRVKFMHDSEKPEKHEEGLRIGVVPVGKHAPGILNVFWGIFDRTKQMGGRCYAFHGVKGLLEQSYIELEEQDFECLKNQGGLELVLRSKRAFLHKSERLDKVLKTCEDMNLDGLVFLGDEMSMTQASFVTEYLMSKKSKTGVIGVPVAGGNSVGGNLIEACVGFDTNARLYASLVGNVLTDAISMPKYWHFVKILGRYPSIEVLECALQTHPNVVIIAEEYRNSDKTLFDIVDEISKAVIRRSKLGKNFGIVLIPDHLVLHLPNTKNMLQEIGNALSKAYQMNKRKQAIRQLLKYTAAHSTSQSDGQASNSPKQRTQEDEDDEFVKMITPWSLAVFASFPEYIRKEILNLDFGEVTLESLEIEVMLAKMVKEELAVRKKKGEYSGNYAAVTHYFGFQGRCAIPTEFDCSLAYTYGYLASICLESKLSGFCCSIRSVCGPVKDWKLFAVPFTCMMKIAPDSFKVLINPKSEVPIIPSNTVNLNGKAFKKLKSARKKWLIEDLFNNPGPMQFNAFVGTQNVTLIIDHSQYYHMITSVERFTEIIKNICKFGVSEEYLNHAFIQLWGLIKITQEKNQLLSLSQDFKLM